ncbi:MAG: hypothetical protein ACPG77_13770, partial [Nannocystaceae bacterium]
MDRTRSELAERLNLSEEEADERQVYLLPEPFSLNGEAAQMLSILEEIGYPESDDVSELDRAGSELSDPYAMFAYISPEQSSGVGIQCGQLGVDSSLYSHPPQDMRLYGLMNRYIFQPSYFFPPIICTVDDDDDDKVCGGGDFSELLTCVPSFGSTLTGDRSITGCQYIGNMRERV